MLDVAEASCCQERPLGKRVRGKQNAPDGCGVGCTAEVGVETRKYRVNIVNPQGKLVSGLI